MSIIPSKTQDLPSFEGLKFSSKLPLGGWARQADWGPCHPDVTVDDHPDGKTANWATEKLLGGELQEPFFLGAGIFQPHLPNYAPQEYFDRFPLEEIKLPEGYRENDLDDVPAAHAKMAHNPWLKTNQGDGSMEACHPGVPGVHGHGRMTSLARSSRRLKNQSTPTTPSSFCGATTASTLAKKDAGENTPSGSGPLGSTSCGWSPA